MTNDESALVVLVPETDSLIRAWRERYDPSAALGVRAHITLLYPFVDPQQIDHGIVDTLAACFGTFAPIEYAFRDVRRFASETLYLAPDPEEPFRALTIAIWKRFPATPPYGGVWREIVPHLSVGRFTDVRELERVAGELALALSDVSPLRVTASEVALIENRTGRWAVRSTFKLGSGN